MDDGEIKVIDCPTEEMWADVMTKPLQGTAFRVMRAELMNCPVNYEDPAEPTMMPIGSPKTVTWKNVVATSFKTPQECVGKDGNLQVKRKADRRSGRTMHPRNTHAVRRVGVARLQSKARSNAEPRRQ